MNITVTTGLTPVRASLTLARKNGDRRRVVQSLTVEAQLASLQGDYGLRLQKINSFTPAIT